MERLLARLPPDRLAVRLALPDFVQAVQALVPSVSADELQRYRQVQQAFAQQQPRPAAATGPPKGFATSPPARALGSR